MHSAVRVDAEVHVLEMIRTKYQKSFMFKRLYYPYYCRLQNTGFDK